jgi:hypothetical protein
VVIQVLIPESQPIDPLPEEFQERVITAGFAVVIANGLGNRPGQADLLVYLGKEANTTVTADVTAVEIGFNFTAFDGWKFERTLVAFCHGGSSCG